MVTALFLENSELSPVTMFVAVALTVCPGTCRSSGRELRHEKRAFPLALVGASTVSRRLFHARIPHQRMPSGGSPWLAGTNPYC
jgi:hypothetical protein